MRRLLLALLTCGVVLLQVSWLALLGWVIVHVPRGLGTAVAAVAGGVFR